MLDNSTIHIMILHNIMLQFVSRKLAVGGKRVFSIFFIQFTFFTWLGTLRMISISYSAEKWSKLRFRNWSERCNSRRLRKSITRSIRSPKSSWTRIIWKGKKRKFFFRFEQFNFQMKYPNFYVGNQECNCSPLYMYIVHTQSAKKIRQVPGQKTCEII